ncbi:MAG: 16S rRNA (cytidine(1402)-2'-O)-methyltransferase, partial [Deltaproteobacteria bacterium]|nr:16S rRNA (cytidine(1402)-2'-O)-methyltransferase [Deltaproteobacteria bacterium]
PSISDPGFELLEAAHNAGIKVTPVPGPSALSATISVSPLKGEGVRFLGFLPRKGRERKERLQSIAEDRSLVIIYESPHRLNSTLTDFIDYCSDSRKVMVAREISKLYEEIKIGTFEELAKYFQHDVKGEIVIAIEGSQDPENPVITDEELESIVLKELNNNRSAKDISVSISEFSGIKKRKIYNLAVKLQNNQ